MRFSLWALNVMRRLVQDTMRRGPLSLDEISRTCRMSRSLNSFKIIDFGQFFTSLQVDGSIVNNVTVVKKTLEKPVLISSLG